ncbi:MAG: hypothetical protein GX491_05555 [Chloroflexi bacterium]|nr:hypothetical protein [Chloroflexota bacterium]
MGENIVIWRMGKDPEAPLEHICLEPAPNSLDEASRRLPGGAYTTFRTYGKTRVLRMTNHYERLEETARLAGKPVSIDRQKVGQALYSALIEYPGEEARVRVTIDLEEDEGACYIIIEPLHVPTELEYEKGVRVVTRKMHRHNPKAKLTGFIEQAAAVRKELPEGISEAVMISEDGRLLEGTSSNFFSVKNGVVWTADEGVLSGISRGIVLDVIREQGIPLELSGLPYAELAEIDEAFITSASRSVLPVVEVDGIKLGTGQPGPITRRLLQGYLARVEQELEPVLTASETL